MLIHGRSCASNTLLEKFTNTLFFIFVCSILVFAFTIASPIHPFVGGTPYTDASVFETVAMMMQRGYMPYLDSFDHKGPVIYLLNYIGALLSPMSGVWFVEFFSCC